MSALEVWYTHITADRVFELVKGNTRRRQKADVQRAVAKSSPELMTEKMTELSHGKLRFKDMPPLISHMAGLSAGRYAQQAYADYITSMPEDHRVLLEK